jgi:hypothetical protein
MTKETYVIQIRDKGLTARHFVDESTFNSPMAAERRLKFLEKEYSHSFKYRIIYRFEMGVKRAK